MPRLVVSGTPHELAQDRITIGRASDNIIRVEDPSVSSRHAHLQLLGSEYYLRDVGSTNGTYVNGLPTSYVRLRVGDQIRFGKVEALFDAETPAATQPLPEPEQIEGRPADSSARPVDFQNASPFRERRKDKDALRTALFILAAIAFLIFLASMLAVLTMRAPAP